MWVRNSTCQGKQHIISSCSKPWGHLQQATETQTLSTGCEIGTNLSVRCAVGVVGCGKGFMVSQS